MKGLRTMRGDLVPLASVSLLVSLPVVLPAQGVIQGEVANGTTGQVVANQVVELLLPRGGMQRLETATSDASGWFVFPSANIAPSSFYLAQATYQGVDYNAPAQFDAVGTATLHITVYDASSSVPPLRIQSARVAVHARGNKVRVQEMLAVRNSSDPPRSYANPDGTFLFRLSPGAAEPNAAVAGPMNMPLPQPVSRGKGLGEYFLQYPLKPGVTIVMVAYDEDYSSNHLALGDLYPYAIASAELLVSPPTLSLESFLFKPAGTDVDTGSRRYVAIGLESGTRLEARLSGKAVGGERAESGPGEGRVKVLTNRMTRLDVPLLACFLLLLVWALGVRLAKEWPRFREQQRIISTQKELEASVEALLDSLADLDALFAAGELREEQYWKERLELRARLMAILKKTSPLRLESHATRHTSSR